MADTTIKLCTFCGYDCTSVAKSDGTIWFCPNCGAQYGAYPQNSTGNTTTASTTETAD